MEMEKELLLATSDGFYYDGTPNKGSYSASKDVTDTITSASTSSAESEEILNKIEGVLVLSQTIILVIVLIFFIKGIMSQRKCKKEEIELVAEKTKVSKKYLLYYICAIFFTIGYGCIEIIKGFLDKF